MLVHPSLYLLLVILVIKPGESILAGNNSVSPTTYPPASESNREVDGNATFFYEADAFLVNKNQQPASKPASSRSSQVDKVKPATGSERNGRMLDLDALVGDFAASQANKERNQSGNRQSRYLSDQPTIEVGNGKKLHIQGFIPIVGVKDVTDEHDGPTSAELADQVRQRQRLRATQVQSQPSELPYAQSSIGHASFGVQRFLDGGDQMQMQPSISSTQHSEAKFSGSSVMESLKKPIKKLTGFGLGQTEQSTGNINQQQQNCLCVPFYMCKNGYISESGLGRSQLQQMIQHQQQQVSVTAAPRNIDLVQQQSTQLSMISPAQSLAQHQMQPQAQQQQPQYVDSYVPVDERSNEREIVTMASILGDSPQTANSSSDFSEIVVDQSSDSPLGESQASAHSNQSDSSSQSDYSQEILGRMLGLKSSPSRSSSAGASTGGVCGILRTCCNIPIHLYPSQQDLANERLMAQYGSGKSQQQSVMQYPASQVQRFHNQQAPTVTGTIIGHPQISSYQQQPQSQFQAALTQPPRLPYGFPSQISRMQPINNFMPTSSDTSLAHRSNQFQVSTRYQAPQVAQFTRSPPQAASVQTFQQSQYAPAQLAKAITQPMGSMALTSSASQTNLQTLALRNPSNGLGTRKILDGRCGIRQSAGITGRVQNLQYHESSADFGEYPGQVAILKRLSGSDSLFVCGGALISQNWVATAAHCIKKYNQADLKVRMGEWDVHRDDEFYPFVEKEVRDMVVHPEFVAGNLVNDIALLRLDSPVDATLPHVNPACLPTIDESFARQRCWVTGWGKDSFGQKGSFQAVLREVELPVVGQAECESALRQTRLGAHYRLHAGFICAGGEGGKDACEGDGGSGLYCIQDGLVKVVGLVSWGIGCGQAGVPGVYVNMAHYRPWLENIISIDEDIYSPYASMIGNSLISERSNSNSTDQKAQPQPQPQQPEMEQSNVASATTTSYTQDR